MIVIVTRGTAGIGLELVLEFYKRGHSIATFGSSLAGVENLKKQFKGEHSQILIKQVNGESMDELEHFIDDVICKFQRIDVLINNAAIVGPFLPAGRVSVKELERVIRINLLAPMILITKVLPWITNNGVILNITSKSAQGTQGGSSYSASKGGLNSFTWSVARDYPNLKVFVYNPGHVNTRMQQEIREKADPKNFPLSIYFKELNKKGKLIPPQHVALQIVHFVYESYPKKMVKSCL